MGYELLYERGRSSWLTAKSSRKRRAAPSVFRYKSSRRAQITRLHSIGVVGPRGAGKTVLLRQIAASQGNSFYLSLDGSAGEDLFATARLLRERYGTKLLLLDEVHGLPDFSKVLKEIFDFLDLRVIFTSSMALALHDSAADLSRRVQLFALHPFSFREYLFFAHGIALPALTLEDLAAGRWPAECLRYEHRFESYLKGGLFPLGLEEPDVLTLLGSEGGFRGRNPAPQ